MNKKSRKRKPTAQKKPIALSDIRQSLGSISLAENELELFQKALTKKHPSIMRWRLDTDFGANKTPNFPHEQRSNSALRSTVPWYQLATNTNPIRSEGDPQLESTLTCDPQGDRLSRSPSKSLPYAAGDFFLQDAGSLLALAACRADTNDLAGKLVCDLCASPGGKASALVEAVNSTGFVLANEPIKGRIPPLVFNLSRTGSDRWAVSSLDPDDLAKQLGGIFDLVLVDAPCSGQALMARGKQTQTALSTRQIEHSASRQRRILAAAVQLLRPGGNLVYSTCTFAEAENEDQVRHLLQQEQIQANAIDSLQPYLSDQKLASYRLWPHLHQCAGAFAASLKLSEQTVTEVIEHDLRRYYRDHDDQFDLSSWFHLPDRPLKIQTGQASVLGWPADTPDWVELIASHGPEVAHRTGQTWKPSHAAGLRRLGDLKPLQVVEVDDHLAKQFLSGQPIATKVKSWGVVSWQGRPLGWMKGNGTIGKNHLPATARTAIH